jgi:crotonobetainyl-CoA:carnitine CoA-transferase CaiB-like acyl-CoA transferase
MSALPLQGVRITDVCAYLAGPYAITLLADLGAEVVKIESIQRLDYLRMMGGFPTPDGYDWSVAFNGTNVNKYGITLNLNHPKGREIFKKLVQVSDIVAENFSPRVMRNWGLSYDELKKINPRIIMLSMPGFGTTGRWRDYVTFGPNIEMLSGIPTISGYRDGPPMMNGYTSDPFASLMGAVAVMVALRHRDHTGIGQYIDLAQVEAVTSFMGGPIMEYTMNRKLQSRRGNRHAYMAPHGVYRCKGDDEWVTIAVSSEKEWVRFCNAVGNPHWAEDQKFSDLLIRYQNQDELDKLIEDWTSQHDKYEVMQILQQAEVPSTAVVPSSELLDNSHFKQRDFFESVTHLKTGTHVYPGFPVRFSETPISIRMPAPTLGQHNEYILMNLLGMTEQQINQLAEEEIIGTKPQGWAYSAESEKEAAKEKKFQVGDLGSGILKSMPKQEDNTAQGDEGSEQ